MKVELTKAQCMAVTEFIDLNFFDVIRKDIDIDNIEWVRAMIGALDAINSALQEEKEANDE